MDAIFHKPRHELLHEQDCFACSLAFAVVGIGLMPDMDPLGNWDEIEQSDGLPGDTIYRAMERRVAYVLHRNLPGHSPAPGRPEIEGWSTA